MIRRPPRSPRTYTLFPYTTLFRAGDECLSSALTEAHLMAVVRGGDFDFSRWWDAFLPRAAAQQPATLFTPATVSDRSDGKIAHLDGLNLTRAWSWRAIASALGPSDRQRGV